MKRGWTYQEAILSRRCLIFTDQQVYFVCRLTTSCEAVTEQPGLQAHFSGLPRTLFEESNPTSGISPELRCSRTMSPNTLRESSHMKKMALTPSEESSQVSHIAHIGE